MTMTWFKLHHDVINDHKLRRFSAQEKWSWIVLLCLASQSDERGVIRADEEDLADMCEFKALQDWLFYKDKLRAKGMIETTETGAITIVNWEKRQYSKPSDSREAVRERVARSRAKKKKEQEETSCNAIQSDSVTPGNTPVTLKCNVDTDTDTDTETNTDSHFQETRASRELDSESRGLLKQIPFNRQEQAKVPAQPSKHPAQLMEERFSRGARREEWEIATNKPDPQFIDWIVAHSKLEGALPPKTMAKQMLYNSRDRGTILGTSMWQEYQESLAQRSQQVSWQPIDTTLDLDAERAKNFAKPHQESINDEF